MSDGLLPLLVGVVQGTPPALTGAVLQSSLSVTFGGASRASGAIDTTYLPGGQPTLKAVVQWDSTTPVGYLNLRRFFGVSGTQSHTAAWVAGATLNWSARGLVSAEKNFASTLNALWQGLSLTQHTAAELTATASLVWVGNSGSALEIVDDQTTITATGASIASGSFIHTASGFVQWARTQVPTDTAFSVVGAAVFSPAAESSSQPELGVSATSTITLHGTGILETSTLQPSGTTVTWEGSDTFTRTAFSIGATAVADWRNLPIDQQAAEVQFVAASALGFIAEELRPTGPFEISARGLVVFRSTRDIASGSDDDDAGDRRQLWEGAAEAERQLALFGVHDEDDLAVLSAALSSAYAQYRRLQ